MRSACATVKADITWLVETKKAHYIAVIKTNQPTAYAQLAALPWTSITVQHTASAHGRREPRSIKTCSIATASAGSPSPTPASPSASTAAASPPASPRAARASL
ncbi:hypothetical protein [Streptomyces marianii]|uniref:hypothetical protein n=1 Tax=Streptomyces marianii TaxID=1817406 RepID=UPI001F16628D|nr:hypothetical protein [Streptomyces marianii]